MKKIFLALCAIAIAVGLAFSAVAKEEKTDVATWLAANRDLVHTIFQESLKCDKPGEMEYTVPGHKIYGTKCHLDGRVKPIVWWAADGEHNGGVGVNYTLIDRLKGQGVPVAQIRRWLAKPANLRAVRDSYAGVIARFVAVALPPQRVIGQTIFECETDQLSDSARSFLRGFVRRRLLEAKPQDRLAIAKLWGEIIEAQVKFLRESTAGSLLPENVRPTNERPLCKKG